jgi:hypothetical protein
LATQRLRFFHSSNPVIRFLASVKLTIVLLILIGLACILGTLVLQASGIGQPPDKLLEIYTQRYGALRHRIFNALSLYHLYGSWWFTVLLLFLTLNMVVCSLRRLRRRWTQLGFQLTHLSIVFLLIGVVLGVRRSHEGQMQVFVGGESNAVRKIPELPVPSTGAQAADIMRRFDESESARLIELPFSIRLESFEVRREKEPIDKLFFVLNRPDSRPRRIDVAFQKKITRPMGRPLEIQVLGTEPLTQPTEVWVAGTNPADPPALKLEIQHMGASGLVTWFTPRQMGGRMPMPLSENIELRYVLTQTREEMQRLLDEKELPTTGTDRIRVAVAGAPAFEQPLKIGAPRRVPGTSVTVTVLRFVPSFSLDIRTREVTVPTPERINPAIHVRLEDGATSEARWVFARHPGMVSDPRVAAQVTFLESEAEAAKPTIYRVLDSADPRDRHVQLFQNGKRIGNYEGKLGLELPIQSGVVAKIAEWFDHARLEIKEMNVPGQVAMRLRIRNIETGKTDEVRLAGGREQEYGALILAAEREYPIEQFISRVQVRENGKPLFEKLIMMNAPLKYKGYTLYQSGYDSEAGDASRYSVLAVKRDPGVWFVYAGFGMLTLGLVIVFYINPLLRRRSGESQS